MCTKEWRRKEQQPKTISIAIIVIIATHKKRLILVLRYMKRKIYVLK